MTEKADTRSKQLTNRKSALVRYGLALAIFAVLIGISALLSYLNFKANLAFLIGIGLVVSVWYGGRGPGILLTALVMATIVYTSPIPPDSTIARIAFGHLSVSALLISIVLLVSSRKAAEGRLREQRELLQITLSSIGDAVIATDIKGAINFLNPTAESLTGWMMAEASGKPLHDVYRLINENTRESVESPFTKIKREGLVVGLANHTILVGKDGREVPIDDSGAPIKDSNGNVIGAVIVFHDVSDRRHAEADKFLLASIVESSEDAIISKDFNRKILSWNKGAENIFGYTAAEAIGKDISTLFPRELLEEEGEIVEKIKRGESVQHYETFRRRKDGSDVPVFLTVSPIRNNTGEIVAISKIARDMSERKRAEERFRRVIEGAPNGMVMIDQTGKITLVNTQVENLFGYSRDELLGQPIEILVPKSFHSNHTTYRADFMKRPSARPMGSGRDLYGVRKDGSEFPVEIGLNPIETEQGMMVLGTIVDITERKNAETVLRESESRLQTVLATALDAVITIDSEGKIIEFNPAAERIFGYTREKVIGQRMAELIIPPAMREAHYKGFGHFLSTGEGPILNKRLELSALRSDGTEFPVELTITPVGSETKPFFTSFIRDITERKRAEQKLFESQKQFQELTESLPQLVWTCRGDDGSCDYLSPQWLAYTGVPEKDQLGFGWIEQIHPDDRDVTIAKWNQAVRSAAVYDVEFRIKRFDGAYRWFKTRAVPFKDSEGNITKWIGTNTDIEDSKQAEEEIRTLNETLEQRVEERTLELEAANKELEAFSYSVSHDLRAPLRAIDGFSQALLEDYKDKLDDEGQDHLGRVREGSQRMARLIDDLLKLSRVTRGDLHREKVNLSVLANDVVKKLSEAHPERSVTLNIEKNVTAFGDERLLRILLENLLGNAWKFTSKCEKAEISFGQNGRGNKIEYFVQDNGAGFDMTYAGKLFGAFQRLHSANDFEGTGIGLATVQRIVHRHGGTIRADGKVDGGAVFYFTL